LSSITIDLFSLTIIIMPSSKRVTQWKIKHRMPYSHQVLCLACQESCLTPQLLRQHLSKNDSCHTSWFNSSNSGTLLSVLRSPNPTKKNARAQWSEFSAIKSDDDDDDNFLYHQLPVYHCNPADDSDDSLSDISSHDKHDNLSSDLLFQEDEQTDSASERQQGNSASEREGGSDEETNSASERDVGFDKETDCASESVDGSGIGASGASGSIDTNPGPVIPLSDETAFSSTPQFPKDQANLVKLELVNLVLEIGAPLHAFHKIAQWATRANSCGHIFKPDNCPITKPT
jgi:hypothetical protein